MTPSSSPERPGTASSAAPVWLGANQQVWRARAVAYVLAFVVLACILVGVRYATRSLIPTLETLQVQKERLLEQQRRLTSEAQQLTAPARVRQYALSRGMVPFSKSGKQLLKVQPTPREAPEPAVLPLSVETRWR